MFERILSLSESQYAVLLLILIVQVALYRYHIYFQYGVVVTLLLLAIYPLVFDCMDREGFSLVFTVLLVVYTGQMVYLALQGIFPAIVLSIILGLYTLVFFFTSMSLNTALSITKPVDAAIGLYEKGRNIANVSQKLYREHVVLPPNLSFGTNLGQDRESTELSNL